MYVGWLWTCIPFSYRKNITSHATVMDIFWYFIFFAWKIVWPVICGFFWTHFLPVIHVDGKIFKQNRSTIFFLEIWYIVPWRLWIVFRKKTYLLKGNTPIFSSSTYCFIVTDLVWKMHLVLLNYNETN